MKAQHFIFEPGCWIGEGKITLSESPTELRFYAKWNVKQSDEGEFEAVQTIEMQGGQEQLKNILFFSDIQSTAFSVSINNNFVSFMRGTGVVEEKKVAWEFRGQPEFEGFEVYQLQEDGGYLFHAEYVSQVHLRSVIEGRIRKMKDTLN